MYFNKVLKFGGSSLGDAERIKNVCNIILDSAKREKIVVVVSAMRGVTDKLLELDFEYVQEKHLAAAQELKIPPPLKLLDELGEIIKGARLIGETSPMAFDLIASFGERLSVELVAAYLNQKAKGHKLRAAAIDARQFIITNDDFQNGSVNFALTNQKISNYFAKIKVAPIVTGFIGFSENRKTTTLGRGGSDYTAAIIGAALGVQCIEIWTDVDGIMSADPKIAPSAFTLPRVSYEEAFEMAHFGAKVIYPPTILPAVRKKIPIIVKNTFNPKNPGTWIGPVRSREGSPRAAFLRGKQRASTSNGVGKIGSSDNARLENKVAKNISAIDNVALITVGGTILAQTSGMAEKVFKSIAEQRINVILISQASSEYTICLAIKTLDVPKAIWALKSRFENEIQKGEISINEKGNQSVIAVIGDKMHGVPGIAGKTFGVLGENKINITAIAQGASERNISFTINQNLKNKAINLLHREFFAKNDFVGIFLIGVGRVGVATLKKIFAASCSKTPSRGAELKIYALANSKKMVFDPKGLERENWKTRLAKSGEKTNLEKFLRQSREFSVENKILVDCTTSESVAKSYEKFVKSGFHIVTPNKKANVLPMKKYLSLRQALAKHQKEFRYEANVGAGLPIITTVKNLISAGDKIKKIEGIFSGTLSYLFNNFDGGKKFSALVQEAKEKKYTEPDPREDLSGQDAGRKLLILARELGWQLELSDARLENLADYDDGYFTERRKKAKSKNCVLRYVGAIANGKLSARLKEVPISDPLANVRGADNIVAIYSNCYNKNPLVIKGPGAGVEVTAAATLNGILKIVHRV